MSPQRKADDSPEVTMAEGNDAEDPRTFDHDAADAVREGELSAAQLPGGGGNVDPENPDAQYPQGRVETTANYPAPDDLRSLVPERKNVRSGQSFVNTSATPDYGTNAEE